MAGELRPVTATIASGTSVSTSFSLLPGEHIAAVLVPSGWTAADIGLDFSADDTTFYPIYDGNRGVTTTTRMRIVNVQPSSFVLAGEAFDVQLGPGFFRLRSISAADNTDVNQTQNQALTVFIGKRH